ncbi:MAG: ABC transporter substrate-binding protein, partial [Hoeflea sp.]|nr:ABC transporter substrate-binding protein [Hoeflea sp.]
YVSPQTGPLAGFAEADAFTIDMFNRYVAEQGMDVEVIVKDSQSNPNRAADVAQELIINNEVNLMLVASTPETTNPVSTVCESEGVPTISTKAPWQPWFIGQQGNPGNPESWKPFDFTYHYFWGLEDVIAVFTNMWNQLDTNKKVGGLFPNDADGNAWGDPNVGVAPGFAAAGYETTDPGRFQNLTDDFTAQINAFKQGSVDIVTGVVIPPDFTTFRNQASQQGFSPKAITVAKAILFPQSVETLGAAGHNLSSEVWWSANHPFSSSLTGQSCAELAAAFTEATGRPWTQPIGFVHSLFEMAADVIKRADDPTDAEGMAETIAKSDLNTIVGRVAWNGEGVPPFAAKNVCKTPLVGGQWRRKDDGTFDLVVVDNQTAPNIPTQGVMEALS